MVFGRFLQGFGGLGWSDGDRGLAICQKKAGGRW